MNAIDFKITDLNCEACVKLSTMALRAVPGVSDVKIDLTTGAARVVADEGVEWKQIEAAVSSVGKTAAR